MSSTATANSLIVETPRGPSIAGTRITIYSVMDYVRANRSREYILRFLRVTPEQLDAALNYIEQHREEVEQDYERILSRAAELRERYEQVFQSRSPYPQDMPWEEKRQLLLEKLEAKKRAAPSSNGNQDPARS